jgi:site-specific recombinase XerD
MPDYALELVDGHLRAPRANPTILVSTAHGIQEVVKLYPTQAGDVPARAENVSATIAALKIEMQALRRQRFAPKASNSMRAYATDVRDFEAYCQAHGVAAVPAAPATLAGYVADLLHRGYKAPTILRRRASISKAHQIAGERLSDDGERLIRPLLGTLRRQLKYPATKAEVDVTTLRRLLRATPPRSAAGARDRVMLLLGFAGGLRTRELIALDVSDIRVTDDRLRIRLPGSAGVVWHSGREVTIPRGDRADTCPVRAIQAWYAISGIRWGALFRPIDRHGRVGATRLTDRAVALVIKRAARRAGLDPARYAGHSLRAGFVTAALAGGAPERVIRAQTGLRSLSTGRRRSMGLFDKSAAAYLGL